MARKRAELPKLQKRIILYLIKHLPQTINGTVRGIRTPQYESSYKSTWFAMKSLEKKGIIKETKKVTCGNNQYPTYWLTDLGIFLALLQKADPTILIEKTREIYPENKGLLCILRTSEIIGTEAYEIAYSALLNKGKLESSDMALIMTVQMQRESKPDEITQLFTILEKECPEYYQQVKENLEQLGINLQRTLEALH